MTRLFAALALVALMGCGADGPPIRPPADLGVSIGSGGVSTSARVSGSSGPVTVSVGL